MSGLSLIELMVALLIGTILTLGLVEVFAASRAAYALSEGLGRVQENGRFAMDYLQRDIRMAGHFGCVNDQAHKLDTGALVSHAALPELDFEISIQGYEASGTGPGTTLDLASPAGGWTPALPAYVNALEPLAGSDIIVLRFLRGNGAPVESIAPAAGNTVFTITAGRWDALTEDGVANPSLFGVADCRSADMFVGAGNSGDRTVAVATGIDRYTPHPSGQTALYRAEAMAYFIAEGTSGEPALFRARWDGAGGVVREELVEGIENLQFVFGRDDDPVDSPSGYITLQDTADGLGDAASSVADEQNWRRVGLVQIGLLASSPDPATAAVAEADSAPSALGVTFEAPQDTRYRASYESTVALRNRLYGN